MAIVPLTLGTGFSGNIIPLVPGAPPVDPLLNQKIVIESITVQGFLQSYLDRDIVPSLETSTGGTWTVSNGTALAGVVRVRVDPTLPNQSYRITGSLTADLLIEGGGWRGCCYALYKWLELIGIKRLGMGDRFMLRPALTDLRLTVSTERNPGMYSWAWGWQGAPSGSHWPVGTTDAEYNAHFYARDLCMTWWGRTRATYGSTDPTSTRLIAGIQSDTGFYNTFLTTNDADPYSYSQLGKTWKQSTFYTAGLDFVAANGNTYVRLVDGLSASTGTGPSGTGASIADGAVAGAWQFVEAGTRNGRTYASFHMSHEGHGTGTDYSGVSGIQGRYAQWLVQLKDLNDGVDVPEFHDCELSLGVAVSDGSPHCMDDKCVDWLRNKGLGLGDASDTDKEILRAMAIMAIAKSTRPGNWTGSSYGYDLQSIWPSDGYVIRSDVFVQLANWGFARDSAANSYRLSRWAARLARDSVPWGIYEFWSLPQYNQSDPRFPAGTAIRRTREMLAAGAGLFQSESPISNGSVGFHMWALGKMVWDGPRTYDDLMAEWAVGSFGAGAAAMRITLDRWWRDEWPSWTGNVHEMATDFQNFHDAQVAAAGDAGSLSRIAVYQAYLVSLHYKAVWRELIGVPGSPPSTAAADAAAEPWMVHNWRTGALTAGGDQVLSVDCVHDHDLLLYSGFVSGAFVTKWDFVPGGAAGYAAWRATNGITPYTDTEIRTVFEAIRGTYSSRVVAVPTPSTLLSFVAPYETTNSALVDSAYMYGGYAVETGTKVLFKVRTGATGAITLGFATNSLTAYYRITIATLAGVIITDYTHHAARTVMGDGSTYTIDLSTLTPQVYRLTVEQQTPSSGWRIVSCPRSVPIAVDGPTSQPMWGDGTFGGWPDDSPIIQPRYFWVDRGVTEFQLHWKSDSVGQGIVIRRSDMATVTPTALGRGAYRVTVPAGHDHAVWRWASSGLANGTPRLYGLRNIFSPTKEQILVPAEAWAA